MRKGTTPSALSRHAKAATNQTTQTRKFATALAVLLVVRDRRVEEVAVGDRHLLHRRREQHVLRVDQVVPRVLGDLELVPERDRVERARELAVAAEDAAAHVDLVDARVALAGRDAVLGGVLGCDDADAVGRARGSAEGAADALLEPVLMPVEHVSAAEARVDRTLELRVLLGDRLLEDVLEGDAEALQRGEWLRAHEPTAVGAKRAWPVAVADALTTPPP